MTKLLAALSIRARVMLLLATGALSMLLLLTVNLHEERKVMLQDRSAKVRSLTESAHALLQHYHTQFAQGRLSETDAQEQAKAAVRALRYDGKEYFWINDLQHVVVAHPMRPEFEGQDKSDVTDHTGKKLYQEIVRVARTQGAGFVDYYWPHGGNSEPIAKVSYVSLFEPWGWVIGTGIYLGRGRDVLAVSAAYGLLVAGIGLMVGVIMLFLARSIMPGARAARPGCRRWDIREDGNLARQVTVGDGESPRSAVRSTRCWKPCVRA